MPESPHTNASQAATQKIGELIAAVLNHLTPADNRRTLDAVLNHLTPADNRRTLDAVAEKIDRLRKTLAADDSPSSEPKND